MEDVVVLGGSGMLGSMVVDVLSRSGMRVAATVRSTDLAEWRRRIWPMVEWRLYDADLQDNAGLREAISRASWIVNAIGLTKPYLRDSQSVEIQRGIRINSLLPYQIGVAADESGARVLQICTDRVYTGAKGRYLESDRHDATDVYGRTKSLGEVRLPNVFCLRCSIIGPEAGRGVFLLEWFRQLTRDARITGFTNHYWNGVTSLHFAKICLGVIRHEPDLPILQHVIPADGTSKAELLDRFGKEFGRRDIKVDAIEAETKVDRTLATLNEHINRRLWDCAGYADPPTVAQMISELARFDSSIRASAGGRGAGASSMF
jgi:dTDP-4-dehydrorhamnose reductase